MWLGMHELAYLATLLSLTLKYHAVTLRNQKTHRETQTHSTCWTKVHPRVQLVEKSTTHRLVRLFLSTLSSGSASLTFINKIERRMSLLKPLWVGLSQHLSRYISQNLMAEFALMYDYENITFSFYFCYSSVPSLSHKEHKQPDFFITTRFYHPLSMFKALSPCHQTTPIDMQCPLIQSWKKEQ